MCRLISRGWFTLFKDHQPFHILEQARALEEVKRLVISKFGVRKIFRHGGDREARTPRDTLPLSMRLRKSWITRKTESIPF